MNWIQDTPLAVAPEGDASAMIEGIQSPYGPGRSVVVVALKNDFAAAESHATGRRRSTTRIGRRGCGARTWWRSCVVLVGVVVLVDVLVERRGRGRRGRGGRGRWRRRGVGGSPCAASFGDRAGALAQVAAQRGVDRHRKGLDVVVEDRAGVDRPRRSCPTERPRRSGRPDRSGHRLVAREQAGAAAAGDDERDGEAKPAGQDGARRVAHARPDFRGSGVGIRLAGRTACPDAGCRSHWPKASRSASESGSRAARIAAAAPAMSYSVRR